MNAQYWRNERETMEKIAISFESAYANHPELMLAHHQIMHGTNQLKNLTPGTPEHAEMSAYVNDARQRHLKSVSDLTLQHAQAEHPDLVAEIKARKAAQAAAPMAAPAAKPGLLGGLLSKFRR